MKRIQMLWMAAATVGIAAGASVAANLGSPDEVLFISNRGGPIFEPYRMSGDGRRVERAVREAGETHELQWSPDGSQYAYIARRDKGYDVYVTNAADGGTRRLTQGTLPSTSPSWAPDGRSIVFVSMRDGSRKLYVMNADGSDQRRLTASSDDELAPTFSPDGTQVAYLAATSSVTPRVSVADVATGKTAIVSQDRARHFETPPRWSPDGKRLLFSSIQGRSAHIVSMAADGSDRKQLTQGDSRNNDPLWSPDGKKILFLAIRGDSPRQGIYVMNADGTAETPIAVDETEHSMARWSADGRRIYFVRQVGGAGKVFSIAADGTQSRALSGDEGSDLEIAVCCSRVRMRVAASP